MSAHCVHSFLYPYFFYFFFFKHFINCAFYYGWQAVQEYYFHLKVKSTVTSSRNVCSLILKTPCFPTNQDIVAFDDGSVVVVTESDLDGYVQTCESDSGRSELWADLSVVYRVQIAGKSALARLSCLWFRCRKISGGASSCSIMADRLGRLNVDIHIYWVSGKTVGKLTVFSNLRCRLYV